MGTINEAMVQETYEHLQRVCVEVERQVIGQSTVIRNAVAACVAGGHVLFEDVPGTGKTTIASSLVIAFGLRFSRVQGGHP